MPAGVAEAPHWALHRSAASYQITISSPSHFLPVSVILSVVPNLIVPFFLLDEGECQFWVCIHGRSVSTKYSGPMISMPISYLHNCQTKR
ncbi:uncharacterized protein [Physcomitrium patens]